MPRLLSLTEVTTILQSGDFARLLGGLEDEHLECKGGPYQLEQLREKMELAKDVSALANADGGIILIGVQTDEEPTYHGDIIRRIGCFAQGRMDFGQYQRVISDWVLPSIRGLRFGWHPSAADPNQGIASVLIPQEASRERPFLVGKVVEDDERVVGSYVGFFERTRDNVTPMKPEELRERLKDGLRFAELDARLGNIEEMVGKAVAGQAQENPALAVKTILMRIVRARREMGYEGKPTLFLAAWPLHPVDFPTLFESRAAAIVQLLENPPRLRNSGFDLSTRRPSNIIEGQLRRCLIPDHKLAELWRDGPLICIVPGDEWHLCWGMRSTVETGQLINNLALAETVYLFCDLALKVYENSVPLPERLQLRIGLSDMTVQGRPASLNCYRLNVFNLYDGRNPAPGPGVHIEVAVDRVNADAGAIAYRLLADLYAWFGFNAADMPFVSRESQPPKIDPAQMG